MYRLTSLISASLRGAALATVVWSGSAYAGPTQLKFAFFASDREFAFRGVVKPFADAVNLAGNGLVQIDLFPGGALGRDYIHQAQLVRSGAADLAWIQPGLTPELFPDSGVLELPGQFRDAQEATDMHTRLAALYALRGYRDIVAIGAFGSPPITIHARAAIASLADLKGRKIRTGSEQQEIVLRALDMQPVSIPINQVSEALNAGTIDGAVAGIEAVVDFGISRFASHHYMLGLGTVPFMIIMNKQKFLGMSEPERAVIRKYSGAWLSARYVTTVESYNDEILTKWKAEARRAVLDPSPEDVRVAEAKFARVADQWAAGSAHNAEMLGVVRSEVGKLRALR